MFRQRIPRCINVVAKRIENRTKVFRLPAIRPGSFVPLISRFIELYPAVMLEVALSDRLVDVVDEGFDAVIRVGQLSDSRLTARSLGNCPMNLVASPEYLKRYGTPSCVDDLGSHSCIQYRYPSSGRTEPWPLLNAGAGDINIIPAVVCNNTDVRLGLALNGKGIVFMPGLLTEKYLASGELEIVLGDIVGRSYDMNIVWPTNRYTTPRFDSQMKMIHLVLSPKSLAKICREQFLNAL
ncbi:hypothetical protein RWF52_002252 [Salmonella enterica]|nr:hypothetical protein [Salmonella enterica]